MPQANSRQKAHDTLRTLSAAQLESFFAAGDNWLGSNACLTDKLIATFTDPAAVIAAKLLQKKQREERARRKRLRASGTPASLRLGTGRSGGEAHTDNVHARMAVQARFFCHASGRGGAPRLKHH